MTEIASGFKIASHRAKIEAYLRDEPVFPVTLELDITSECSRTCSYCPSGRSPEADYLSMRFVAELFACFEQQTSGLLLTGGEATIAPDFPEVLRLARRSGFKEIAVVTNGSQLAESLVAEALLEHATTIRVSMYDWEEGPCLELESTLGKIQSLRSRIDRSGSGLQIGVSILTSAGRAHRLGEVAEAARGAGAHWVYFHPMCVGWNRGCPERVDQAGVLEAIRRCRDRMPAGFPVFVSNQRYENSPLEFTGYHAAHFLLVIGADGKNYLGAEVKYHPAAVVADVAARGASGFLFDPDRAKRIAAATSANYGAIGSRHRGVLYSDYIERLKRRPERVVGLPAGHRFEHIL